MDVRLPLVEPMRFDAGHLGIPRFQVPEHGQGDRSIPR
jgi:hypothetical protein